MKKLVTRIWKKSTLTLVALSLTLAAPLTTYAAITDTTGGKTSVGSATLQDVINAINRLTNTVMSLAYAAVQSNAKLMYEEDPNLPATIVSNQFQQPLFTSNVYSKDSESGYAQTHQFLETTIANGLTQSNILTKTLSDISGSDTYIEPTPGGKNIFALLSKPNPLAGNVTFNFNTLFNTAGYTDNKQAIDVHNFIDLVGGTGQPVSDINWAELDDKQKQLLQTDPIGQQYRVMIRSLVATRSVGLANLYHLMAERIPVKNLGANAGLNKADASPLEVEEYINTRRTQDKQWYADMAKASPATVQRETLFALAEMQRQLFQMHLDNERLIATLSVMELQNTQLNQILAKQKEAEIKQLLYPQKLPGMSGSGSSSDSSSPAIKELKDSAKESLGDEKSKELQDKMGVSESDIDKASSNIP